MIEETGPPLTGWILDMNYSQVTKITPNFNISWLFLFPKEEPLSKQFCTHWDVWTVTIFYYLPTHTFTLHWPVAALCLRYIKKTLHFISASHFNFVDFSFHFIRKLIFAKKAQFLQIASFSQSQTNTYINHKPILTSYRNQIAGEY